MNIEKAFDRVQRKVLKCAMRKKRIAVMLRPVSLHDGATSYVRVDSKLSEDLEVLDVECYWSFALIKKYVSQIH